MKSIKLSIKDLNQNYGEKPILKDINLDVYEGETVVLLGSSGCGKTTLLKAVAGLVTVQSGTIRLDRDQIENLPPQERRATMIFQNYALFPHMTVKENLEYGLKIRHHSRDTIRQKREEVVRILRLEGLEERPVARLSGGQQQRVAIGRALIVEPSVLLFDEPLSNLDENLRKSMRGEIKRILRELGSTSLYVTHDQNEAISMADRVVVMSGGRIEQIDSPEKLYARPVSEEVARFLGFSNIFPLRSGKDGLYLISRENEVEIPLPVDLAGTDVPEGELKVLIRPEEIRLVDPAASEAAAVEAAAGEARRIILDGTVLDRELQIGIISYTLTTVIGPINVNVLNHSEEKIYQSGTPLVLVINPGTLHFIGGVRNMKDQK
ncbi:MAG: ABC transporter ATP-binding protein [Spirochaetales bacterium]|nr:ABC transporter ATP-binding protein [Spirochaetales bacterium]